MTLTPTQMLAHLDEHGQDAGSDFNDGELEGWFGWSVSGDVLEIRYTHSTEDGNEPEQIRRWVLVPIGS